MKRVVVIGGDHHNTLGVIRSLGIKGIKPDVLIISKEGKSFVRKSKYIKSFHIIQHEKEIVHYLLEHLSIKDDRAILICCSDGASSEVDLHANYLSQYFITPGSNEPGRITKLMNKKTMAELAQECGLSIPPSFYPSNYPLETNDVFFPCIVKPIASIIGNKGDIHICYDLTTLNQAIAKLGINNVQIQQFIDKDYEYQLIGCSTGADVVIPGVSRILRPCKGSNTSFLHYERITDNSYVLEKCKEFVKRTGYKGLFSLEFLRDKSGNNFFMEMNFRNDGNSICVTASGVNLPYIWYLYCSGCNYSEEACKIISPIYVMPDSAELRLLLTKQINIFQYLSDLFKTNCFMEFDRKDSKPFWEMIRIFIGKKIKRLDDICLNMKYPKLLRGFSCKE